MRDSYFASEAIYDQQLEEYLQAVASDPNTTQEAPLPPPSFNKAMLPPEYGYPVNLPAGTYDIHLLGYDGQIISGSERTLIAFEPRREGVGYTVIPENKWTIQESSDIASQVVYFSNDDNTLFLQAYRTLEFNEQLYTRLEFPQETTSSKDQWIWVRDTLLNDVKMQVLVDGKSVGLIGHESFSIIQTPGSALGYSIELFDPLISKTPDFEAFMLDPISGVSSYSVQLLGGDGIVISGSERELVQTNKDLPLAAYSLIFFPILIRLAAGLWRKYYHH